MAAADNDNMPKPTAVVAGETEFTGAKCPICGKPAVKAARPFCSKRCADVDLGRWMSGSYLIAGGQSDADEDGDDTAALEAHRARPKSDAEPET